MSRLARLFLSALTAVFLAGAALSDDPDPRTATSGANAYKAYPEPLRSELIKEWESELNGLHQAMKADVDRLRRATTPKDRKKFERAIQDYKDRIARHERNDPPYVKPGRPPLTPASQAPAPGDARPEVTVIPPSGKPGVGAYDLVPEPRRRLLVKEWRDELARAKESQQTAEKTIADSAASLRTATRAADNAKADVEQWEKKLAFDSIKQYRVNLDKAKTELKKAGEAAARAASDKASGEGEAARAKARVRELEENDPPFNLGAELAKADAARRAEEETDFGGGLILLKKTCTNDGQTASGTVLNRSGRDLRYVRIKMNLYDKDGAKVGDAVATTTDLEAGGKWAYKARMIATAPVASCKVYEIRTDAR